MALSTLGEKQITQLALGNGHSLMLLDDGSVYSVGHGSSGQTGLGESGVSTSPVYDPTPIDTTYLGERRVVKMAAGEFHNLLLTEDGSLFAFGQNDNGKTGLGTDLGVTTIASPIDMTVFGGKEVKDISAGRNHSLVLTRDGTVFAFGLNLVIGVGVDEGNSMIPTPIDTTYLAGLRVIGISAGGGHNLLLAVPEPTSAMLLLFACLPLVTGRWRKS